MRKLSIIAWLGMVVLAGCGGTSKSITGESGTTTGTTTGTTGTTGSTGTTTPTVTAASLTATSSTTSILSDGSTTATITVLARNSANDLIPGVVVAFSADSGGVAITQATTDDTGAATATLSTAGESTARTITVTATASGLTATVQVQVVAASTAATSAVASLTVTSNVPSILTDGSTTATVSALARDASNNVLAGIPVSFAASSGAIAVTQATTDATGVASGTVSTAGDSMARTIVVTSVAAKLSATVDIGVVAPSSVAVPVYAMGNGTGTAFASGAIGFTGTGDLAAGGTRAFALTIVDQTDTLYSAGPVVVTFNSPCIAAGTAQILPSGSAVAATTITTMNGTVTGSYVAKGCSTTDTIRATATVGGQNLSATGSLTVDAATVGSIQFESATPTTIGLKGTGLGETSTVIFKVTDSTGAPEANVPVTFTLDTSVGGLGLSPSTATSGSDGTVQTVVSSGTQHTTVRVTATIASPALSTQSSQLTVSTGLPASAAFSIATGVATYASTTSSLACPNVEAYNIDGVTVPITVSLADRYNNPVPDGTAVAFTTNGGHVGGSCTTTGAAAGNSACQVTWTSANPRPALASDTPDLLAAGRSTILATAIGEESFTDLNGTGYWQSGDPFAHLGEPYRDDNENGIHDAGEYFLDFNKNQQWDPSTGTFVGITCNGSSATSTCSTSTLAIGVSHLVIMSTGQANVSLASVSSAFTSTGGTNASLSIAVNTAGTLTVNVQDLNGNSMAAGTTIAATYNNTTGTLTQTPSPYTVGCNADVGGVDIQLGFAAGAAAGNGTISVAVTSPSGSATYVSIPVTIHP